MSDVVQAEPPGTAGLSVFAERVADAPGKADTEAPSAAAAAPRLSNLTLCGFSVGMIGDRIFRDAPALLLLIFMTNYLGIPPAMAGTAIFVPKLLIMFVDPMVGTWSDRLQSRFGRRRPLMFLGAVLASASIVLFFHVPRFATPGVQAVYMSFLVLLGFTGYSLNSVPYLTMASEVATGPDERSRIMSWRVGFMAVGLSLSAFAGAFVQELGGGMPGYETMSWVYGGVCLVTMLTTVLSSGHLAKTESDGVHLSLLAQARLIAANRRFLGLLLVGFAQKVGEGVGYGSFAYFCIYVVHQPLSGIGLVVLASVAGQILTQPLWLWASRRWPPTTLYTAGVLGWCLNLLLWLAMRDQSSWWLIPLGLQGGAAAGGFLMVTLAMLSNALAGDVQRTGLKREGIYSGFWLAAEKLAFALGALIVSLILAAFGFVESTQGSDAAQTTRAVIGIAFAYSGCNLLIYVASIFAIRRFARMPPATAA
jgi:GPH family glycoside/pentoside/hexuronide:cation symporter